MANEITLNLKMAVDKTYLRHSENPGTINVDMSGSTAIGGAQAIGTSAEAITTRSRRNRSNAGIAALRNIHASKACHCRCTDVGFLSGSG